MTTKTMANKISKYRNINKNSIKSLVISKQKAIQWRLLTNARSFICFNTSVEQMTSRLSVLLSPKSTRDLFRLYSKVRRNLIVKHSLKDCLEKEKLRKEIKSNLMSLKREWKWKCVHSNRNWLQILSLARTLFLPKKGVRKTSLKSFTEIKTRELRKFLRDCQVPMNRLWRNVLFHLKESLKAKTSILWKKQKEIINTSVYIWITKNALRN